MQCNHNKVTAADSADDAGNTASNYHSYIHNYIRHDPPTNEEETSAADMNVNAAEIAIGAAPSSSADYLAPMFSPTPMATSTSAVMHHGYHQNYPTRQNQQTANRSADDFSQSSPVPVPVPFPFPRERPTNQYRDPWSKMMEDIEPKSSIGIGVAGRGLSPPRPPTVLNVLEPTPIDPAINEHRHHNMHVVNSIPLDAMHVHSEMDEEHLTILAGLLNPLLRGAETPCATTTTTVTVSSSIDAGAATPRSGSDSDSDSRGDVVGATISRPNQASASAGRMDAVHKGGVPAPNSSHQRGQYHHAIHNHNYSQSSASQHHQETKVHPAPKPASSSNPFSHPNPTGATPAPRSIPKLDDGEKWNPKFRSHHNDKWEKTFQDLCQFKQLHGHCLVPNEYVPDLKLSMWVRRQRYHYKLRKASFQSNLSDDRLAKLEGIGFVWDIHAASWEERFAALAAFKAQYGHCHVQRLVSTGEDNGGYKTLMFWVKHQRRQHRYLVNGKQSSITQDRITKLESIGFEWTSSG